MKFSLTAVIQALFLIMISSIVLAAESDDCSPVDLREKGQSMYQAPNFDQGSSEYCWAFAGTQLASAVIQKENQKNFNFPAHEVALSPTFTLNKVLSGSSSCFSPCEIVNDVLRSKKGCSYKDVTYDDGESQFHPDTGETIRFGKSCGLRVSTISQVENDLEAVFGWIGRKQNMRYEKAPYLAARLSEKNSAADSLQHQLALRKFMSRRDGKISKAMLYNFAMSPSCVNLEDVSGPWKGSQSLNQVLSSAAQRPIQCHEFRTEGMQLGLQAKELNCPLGDRAQILSKEKMLDKIHEAFNGSEGYPVVIDYCFTFMFDGEVSKEPVACKYKSGRVTTDHKSLLIGRRFNAETRQCEFLLRNSWGKDCTRLHEKFQEQCEKEKRRFGAADIWVPQSTLEKAVHGVSALGR